jgi:tol-pal system protein YbgF
VAAEPESVPPPRPAGVIDESDLEIEREISGEEPPAGTAPVADALDPAVREEMEALYDAALDQVQRRENEAAEASFRAFLARYPATDLADNAQYWLAESFLRRGDGERALAEFRAVVERYPQGNKVPDALFKIGIGLEGQKEPALAREVYEELLRRFPGAAAAESARARLDLLAGDAPETIPNP